MIKRINIKNYKSIRDQEINLKEINFLIGPNNSGKSNFLDSLFFLQSLFRSPIDDVFGPGPFSYSRTFCRASNIRIEGIGFDLDLSLGANKIVNYNVEFKSYRNTEPSGYVKYIIKILKENWGLKGKEPTFKSNSVRESWFYQNRLAISNGEIDPPLINQQLKEFIDTIRQIKRYQFVPKLVKKEGKIEVHAYEPYLEHDGSNLVNVLYNLREDNPGVFSKILMDLKEFFPSIETIKFTPFGENILALNVTKRQGGRKWEFLGPQLSDGFAIILSILILLNQPTAPKIILMEELENGLNPSSIKLILKKMFEVSKEKGTQFIISTHSPVLLELLQEHPEYIIICENEKGLSVFTPLEEKLKKFKGDYQKGESLIELWLSGLIGGL